MVLYLNFVYIIKIILIIVIAIIEGYQMFAVELTLEGVFARAPAVKGR